MGSLRKPFFIRIIILLTALDYKTIWSLSVCQGCKAPERQGLDILIDSRKKRTRAVRSNVTDKLFKKKTTVPNRYGSQH